MESTGRDSSSGTVDNRSAPQYRPPGTSKTSERGGELGRPRLREALSLLRLQTLLTAQAIFYYMAAASVVSALLAVTRRNPVHSMLWVLALFLHMAGMFLLLDAEFLAAVQVIVYAGAILIFYLFVVMLLDLPDEEARPRFGPHCCQELSVQEQEHPRHVEEERKHPEHAVDRVPAGDRQQCAHDAGGRHVVENCLCDKQRLQPE